MKKIFFVTGELSGDVHAASLLKELYKIISPMHLVVKAVGSSNLEACGAKIFFDCKYLNSVGLTEVIKKLSLYLNFERELLFELQIFRPDVLILVDFPGFNLRIAQKARKLLPDTKIVYYLPPQVWAWNQGRTKILKDNCDLVLCGLPFEEEFHRKRGVNAFYVGNPLVDELENYDREKIRGELGVSKDEKLIGLFPGSRKSEIKNMLPVFLKAAELFSKDFPGQKFMIAQASTISDLSSKVENYFNGNGISKNIKTLLPGNNHKLLCASDFVWLASGTVTLEAALYETPLILGYRSNYINYLLFLLLKRVSMVGLPNIIAGEKIVPELLQGDSTPEKFSSNTKEILNNKERLEKIKKTFSSIKEILSQKNACKEAALKIRELIPEYKVFAKI